MSGRCVHRGVELVTAADVKLRWPDVSAGLLRLWVHRGLLGVVCGPDGQPVRLRGANVYRWPDVVAAERAARLEPRGRHRNG